jgi:MinD-like ATPase involved in chromosome partitioning or flagellar assembly
VTGVGGEESRAYIGRVDEDFWPQDEVDGQPAEPPRTAHAGVPISVPVQKGIPMPPPAELTLYEPALPAPPPNTHAPAVPHPVAPIPINPHTAPIAVPPPPQVKPLAPERTTEHSELPQTAHSAWAQPPVAPPQRRPAEEPVQRPVSGPLAPTVGVPHQVPPAPVPRRGVAEIAPGVIPITPEQPAQLTADEFARRRAAQGADPEAQLGIQATLRKSTFGLVSLSPGRREQELRHDLDVIRRNFGGLRQITVVNPKGGAGKTVAVLMLAMTLGQRRGGYVLAWDNNETQGTLGMRAQQDFHHRTVRDLLRDLAIFRGTRGRVGELSQYVRAQGEGMFEVLASDESATAGEMLTDVAFGEIRDVVSRFYKIIVVDTGNNVRAPNWQAAVDATDQLVVTLSARNDSAETAARMLDHLEQTGRTRLVRQAVTVLSMPQHAREMDADSIERHFAARTRAVVPVPYDRLIDTGEPIRYGQLTTATHSAWLKVAASVAEGL